jgi:CheY-like chemotaxis protein
MKFSILTIEDTSSFRQLIRMTLEFEGHKVIEADNGRRGLELARSSPIDLILLDLRLPDMDGLDVCRELRSGKITAKIPVVVLSSSEDSNEIEACVELGAVGYLMKPFRPPHLLDMVTKSVVKA